ncbi:DUF6010 family protein [Georgenia thermotolerans]|uniref:Uncharacterized protein n=1 Tax=Georgenia thermotolerans TaxID=527326 RepID=A0A7J5UMZ4_9MICO|nr:DUF6010 family protein [Georgenia thermotolerans]KAE8763758.1 hypothetical protein GB883_12505 [Georgenia thermotolerans]
MTASTTPDAPATMARRAPRRGPLARRWPTAVGVVAAAASLALVAPLPERVQTSVGAWSVLLAAVIYLTWGTARGELSDRRLLGAQTAAVLTFGAVAVAAVAVTPDAARVVLAAGWLAHAAWDVAHHRAGRVVPRWYAETCMAADVLLAVGLLAAGAL